MEPYRHPLRRPCLLSVTGLGLLGRAVRLLFERHGQPRSACVAPACFCCGIDAPSLYALDIVSAKHRCENIGVDWPDNTQRYTIDNLIVCCPLCNGIKSDLLTVEEMRSLGGRLRSIWEQGSGSAPLRRGLSRTETMAVGGTEPCDDELVLHRTGLYPDVLARASVAPRQCPAVGGWGRSRCSWRSGPSVGDRVTAGQGVRATACEGSGVSRGRPQACLSSGATPRPRGGQAGSRGPHAGPRDVPP